MAPTGDRDLTLVWVDLELTGLNSNPDGDAILEAAIAVTGSVPALETAVHEFVIWQPESVLARMSPAVRKMHTLNGLIDRVRQSTQALAEVERARFEKDDSHTAAGDVRASMAELLSYRSLFGAP